MENYKSPVSGVLSKTFKKVSSLRTSIPWSACTFFLLVVLLNHPVDSYSQYQEGMFRLYYSNSGGERGVTTYIYNGNPYPYKAVWELEDGSRWSVNLHEFDDHGNMVRKTRDFSDSVRITQTFTYNNRNQLVSETFNRTDGVTGQADYFYLGGRVDHAVCKGLNGWFHGIIRYQYHTDNKLPGFAILEVEGTEAGQIIFSYNKKGQLAVEEWYFRSGFSQTLQYSYIDTDHIYYRSSNVFMDDCHPYVISREEYDYNGISGGPSFYSYDDSWRLSEKTFVRSDGLKTITEYRYLADGRLERSIRHYSDGKTGTFLYTYDDAGRLIKRDFSRSDGLMGAERYCYDASGRLISAEWENFDSWLSGKLRFTHDRYDRIETARFISRNGVNAEIDFEWENFNCLSRVAWRFVDGTTQTYRFIYQDAAELTGKENGHTDLTYCINIQHGLDYVDFHSDLVEL